ELRCRADKFHPDAQAEKCESAAQRKDGNLPSPRERCCLPPQDTIPRENRAESHAGLHSSVAVRDALTPALRWQLSTPSNRCGPRYSPLACDRPHESHSPCEDKLPPGLPAESDQTGSEAREQVSKRPVYFLPGRG